MKKKKLNTSFFRLNKGLLIVISVSIILLVIAYILPVPSAYNDFIAKLGSLVTIFVAAVSYLAWSNTQKLIERHKEDELKITAADVIVGIECLKTRTGLETSIKNALEGELSDLKELVKGSEIKKIGDINTEELGFPGSCFEMRISKEVPRGIIICAKMMPTEKQQDLEKFISDYREVLQHLYELLSKTDCKTVHMFFATPVALSPFVMPYFVNKMNVIAYQYDHEKYVKLGVVDKR